MYHREGATQALTGSFCSRTEQVGPSQQHHSGSRQKGIWRMAEVLVGIEMPGDLVPILPCRSPGKPLRACATCCQRVMSGGRYWRGHGEDRERRRWRRRMRWNPRPISCCWLASWLPSSGRRGKMVSPHPSPSTGSHLCPFCYLCLSHEQSGLCLQHFMLGISKFGFSHAAEQHWVSSVGKIHSAGHFSSWHLWCSWQQNATCEGFMTALHWQLPAHSSWFSCHICLTEKSWANTTLLRI